MDEATTDFLRTAYKECYFKNSKLIEFPAKIEEREFGYTLFGDGRMIRHLSFKSPGQLLVELIRQGPSSVYCSNARYSSPTAPMDEKGWNGAELIFDIDADAIPTPCKAKHNIWFCQDCSRGGRNAKPKLCPHCQGSNLSDVHWACKECLTAVKTQVFRLVDFLEKDFGVSHSRMNVYFSGNRGYHVHVYDERFEPLDSQARAEIANYLTGTTVAVRTGARSGAQPAPSFEAGYGWASRIAERSRTIAAEKGARPRLLAQIVQAEAIAIDQSVTIDIHRIFRMAGTLHGSSGLLKMRVESLDSFDPESDPVVISDETVRIFVTLAPQFQMKGTKYGPYSAQSVDVPAHAAVYLLARGLGRLD